MQYTLLNFEQINNDAKKISLVQFKQMHLF